MCEGWSGPNEPHKKLFRNCKGCVGQFDHIRLLCLAICCHLCFCIVYCVKTGVLQQAREMGWLQERAGRWIAFCHRGIRAKVQKFPFSSVERAVGITCYLFGFIQIDEIWLKTATFRISASVLSYQKKKKKHNLLLFFWWPTKCSLKLPGFVLDALYM